MGEEKRGLPNLTSLLTAPIGLVVLVGIAQITFAVGVLSEGRSKYWFVTIMVVGMFLNMGIVAYTTILEARSR
jgi:hypothetical protein